MTILILIRHGETDWNVEGRYQGQADPTLNSNGIQQAHHLVHELRESNMQLLYSSPLRRATQTAQVIAKAFEIPMYLEPRLMEIHQGDWQTRLRSEIESLYPDLFKKWESQPWETMPPGGESLVQVQMRVFQAIDDLKDKHPKSRVGLVTHRIPIALIKMRYQEFNQEIIRTIHLPNTYWEAITIP